jgi:hypothetical protein
VGVEKLEAPVGPRHARLTLHGEGQQYLLIATAKPSSEAVSTPFGPRAGPAAIAARAAAAVAASAAAHAAVRGASTCSAGSAHRAAPRRFSRK